MSEDILKTDLEVEGDAAFRTLADFERKLETTAQKIDSVAKKQIIGERASAQFNVIEVKAERLRRSLDNIARVNAGRGFDVMAIAAERASVKVQTIQKQLEGIKKAISEGGSKTVLDQLTNEARALESQLTRTQNAANRFNARGNGNRPPSAPGGNAGGVGEGFAGGLGIPTSAAGGAAIVAGAIVLGAKESLDAAKNAAQAQLQLNAIAKETGTTYTALTVKAAEFGRINNLSNAEGQKTFANIVNFANAAGRTEKLDEFTRKFSDLAAAKGINASQLGDISRQLNALTDEATDKLLNANPSAFYDAFAKSLNTTAEKLTDAQKRAAVFDEVLRRGALFDGTAEKKVNDAAFATDRLAARFDNARAAAGRALQPVAELLDKFTGFVGNTISGNSANNFGKSEAEKAAIKFNNENLERQRVAQQVGSLNASDAEIKAASQNSRGSLRNFALSQVNLATGFNDEAARNKAINEAVAGAQTYVSDLTKKLNDALQRGDATELKFANKDFLANINLFAPEDREKFIKQFSGVFSDAFRKVLTDTPGNVRALRKALSDIGASASISSGDRGALTKDFSAAINAAIQGGKEKIKEIEKQNDSLFEKLFAQKGAANPFVQVFSEADKAIETVRLTTANLSKELQGVALNLQQNANAAALFGARLDSGLQAIDLRETAARFRNNGAAGRAPAPFAQNVIDEGAQRELNRRSPFGMRGAADISTLTPEQKETLFQTQIFNDTPERERAGLVSLFARQAAKTREGGADGDGAADVQTRLQKQIDFVNSLNAKTDEEKSIANRRILSLAGTIRPEQLTDAQRSKIADAADSEAREVERRESVAAVIRAESNDSLKKVAADMAELVKIAKSDGLTGVIRIVNEATDAATVALGKRPNDRSTEAMSK